MKRLSQPLSALLLLTAVTLPVRGDESTAQESPQTPRITLANGDYATGKLVDSDQTDHFCWQCDGLIDKLVFPIAAVSSIHFPLPTEKESASDDFSFELVGGDVLIGSLKSLTDKHVELNSELLGTLRIDRDQVRRIARFGVKGETIYSGPNRLAGWASSAPDHPWKDEGGQLAAAAPGEISFNEFKIPEKASVDIEASWQQKASFAIHIGAEWQTLAEVVDGFGRILGQNVRVNREKNDKLSSLFSIETWGDWIVIVRETERRADVSPLVRIEPGPGRIHLRILFDQTAGRVTVYSADGTLLGEASAPEDEKRVRGGLRLENKKGDLRIEYLAVHSWFGDKPMAVDAERSYLQTSQGTVHYLNSLAYDADVQEFVVTASEKITPAETPAEPSTGAAQNERQAAAPQASPAPNRLALASVTTISLQPSAAAQPQPMRAALFDGSRISGEPSGIVNGRLLLRRQGINVPLELPINQLRMLATLSSKMPKFEAKGRAGRLESDGLRLHGWLMDSALAKPNASPTSCLRWQSLVSVNSSPLAEDFAGSIAYRELPQIRKSSKKLTANQKRLAAVQARAAARANPVDVAAVLQAVEAGDVKREKPVIMNDGAVRDTQLLWLRAGDRLPCTIESIDDRGVTFKSTAVAATFLPHDAIKAWEREGGRPPKNLDPEKRERLLTLPRMQRANPPTHLIESTSGDYLRGHLEELDETTLQMSVRLETKKLAVDDVASIVWFEPLAPAKSERRAPGIAAKEADDDEGAVEKSAAANASATKLAGKVQAVRADGVRVTFRPENVTNGVIIGDSNLIGACHVDVREVDQLLLGQAIGEAAADLAYHQWRLKPAVDPQFVTEGTNPTAVSEGQGGLTGKPAPDFRLQLVDEGEFALSLQRGKIVVLDFWASWCGPCMQSMPKLAKLAKEFDATDIRFVGVNMQEDRETVVDALERLQIELEVALDVDGAAGEKFAVAAIPHTVVIDRRGNVAAVLIGGGPDSEQQLRDALTKLLNDATSATP